eukprot:9470787-Pyramimonas_sp.AAC.3
MGAWAEAPCPDRSDKGGGSNLRRALPALAAAEIPAVGVAAFLYVATPIGSSTARGNNWHANARVAGPCSSRCTAGTGGPWGESPRPWFASGGKSSSALPTAALLLGDAQDARPLPSYRCRCFAPRHPASVCLPRGTAGPAPCLSLREPGALAPTEPAPLGIARRVAGAPLAGLVGEPHCPRTPPQPASQPLGTAAKYVRALGAAVATFDCSAE